jgi:DNA-directed RNA polymerase specialized sigma54-like protein
MDADTQYWKSVADSERKKNAQLLKRCGELAQDKDDLCKRLDEREATIKRLVAEIEGKNGDDGFRTRSPEEVERWLTE